MPSPRLTKYAFQLKVGDEFTWFNGCECTFRLSDKLDQYYSVPKVYRIVQIRACCDRTWPSSIYQDLMVCVDPLIDALNDLFNVS